MTTGSYETEQMAGTRGAMEKYVQLKTRLLGCIDEMLACEHVSCEPCRELKEKVEANCFNLVVVGQFKRGKTYFINALLGAAILPVAVVPLTSIVTVLTFGESLSITVHFNNGNIIEIPREELPGYVTETGNPKNAKEVRKVVVSYPSEYLRDGVNLIDTPGVGSVFQHNTDMAYQYLPKSDAALFLLSVEQPVSRAELDFLRDVRQYSGRIFFLLNKIDYLTDEEREESLTFARNVIREVMDADVKVFPVSAKLALQGKMNGSPELLEKSNLPAFSEKLNEFLMDEKGRVLLLSASSNGLRAVSQAKLRLELELRSLTEPMEELKAKLELFRQKKEEVLREREDFEILLEGEVGRLISTNLDGSLAAFKGEIIPQVKEKLKAFHEEHKHLVLKELNDALDAFVTVEIEGAITLWRSRQDEALGAAFDEICKRFIAGISEKVEMLLRYSSELFAVPFESVQAESLWTPKDCFYCDFRNELAGLEMLGETVTQVLPGYISNRFQKVKDFVFRIANRRIYDKIRRRALEMIDVQCGRIRYDFVSRIEKGEREFRREALDKMDATVEGIGSAIEKGLKQRSRGEAEVAARHGALAAELAKLDGIREEYLSIRELL